jgi:hypothetical protein
MRPCSIGRQASANGPEAVDPAPIGSIGSQAACSQTYEEHASSHTFVRGANYDDGAGGLVWHSATASIGFVAGVLRGRKDPGDRLRRLGP